MATLRKRTIHWQYYKALYPLGNDGFSVVISPGDRTVAPRRMAAWRIMAPWHRGLREKK